MSTRATSSVLTPTTSGRFGRWSARRRLRAAVGTLWMVAGLLQLQPFMFTPGFAHDVLGSSALSQPAPLGDAIGAIERFVAANAVASNWAFALAELTIGAGMLFARSGRVARLACTASTGWGLGVWCLGEGMGAVLTGHAALTTGAPGAAALYVVLTVAAWPRRAGLGVEGPMPARLLIVAWSLIWLLGAVLAVLPAQRGARGLGAQAAMGWMMAPSWASGPTLAVAKWLDALAPLAATLVAAGVVAVHLAIGLGVLRSRTRGLALIGGAVLTACYWMFGQGFGGLSTGTATDVGTAPLVALLAVAMVNRRRPEHVAEGMNRYPLAAAAAACAVLLASCSSSSKPSAPITSPNSSSSTSAVVAPASSGTTAAPAAGIVISGFAFSGTMTVKPGQKVTVTNKDSVAHTLTDKKTHLFDTGNINGNGGTGSFTAPSKPGSYQFGCTYHPNMHGTLIVQG